MTNTKPKKPMRATTLRNAIMRALRDCEIKLGLTESGYEKEQLASVRYNLKCAAEALRVMAEEEV